MIGTWLLAVCCSAIGDKRNMRVPTGVIALYTGLLVAVIGLSFGYNCGAAINPARDLAPRLLTLIAAWGTHTFRYGGYPRGEWRTVQLQRLAMVLGAGGHAVRGCHVGCTGVQVEH